jgi:hypothetical protein
LENLHYLFTRAAKIEGNKEKGVEKAKIKFTLQLFTTPRLKLKGLL